MKITISLLGPMLLLSACASAAPAATDTGPDPALPPPSRTLLPTVNVAPAVGWPTGQGPRAADGLRVQVYARGLDHPRWLYLLPNGDVVVAESDAPPKAQTGDKPGLLKRARAWFTELFMKKAGSHKGSANRLTLLRDADGDGVAEQRHVFLEGLNSPLGMALVGEDFYVANTDAVLRYRWQPGQTRIEGGGQKLVDLPAQPPNRHWTRNLIASPDGRKLYVAIGSNSNIAEDGLDKETGRAAVWEIDRISGAHRVYASGLRNPVGLAWEPDSGELWTAVNERDELGNDLVPDYMTSLRDGGFYGWPWSYFGAHVDERVEPRRPDMVARALKPDYALGAHTASLGLCNAVGSRLPPPFLKGMFIGQHGSWNRKPHSGYKVVFVPFDRGRPVGPPMDVLSGFLSPDGKAYGRPVGVAFDGRGALLVADDAGNVIWRVSAP